MTLTFDGYTFTSPFAEAVWPLLTPWQTLHMAIWVNAAGTIADQLYALVDEQGTDGDTNYTPTWGPLFDVTQCPTEDLPYLAQYVGVQIPRTADDATARQLILAEAGMKRGTLGSIQSAVSRSISTVWAPSTAYTAGVMFSVQPTPGTTDYYLVSTNYTSGTSFGATDLANAAVIDPLTQFAILERNPDPYTLTIVCRPEQLTPASDATALTAAVTLVKPAGILLNIIQSDAPLVSQYTRLFSAITVTLDTATLADVT